MTPKSDLTEYIRAEVAAQNRTPRTPVGERYPDRAIGTLPGDPDARHGAITLAEAERASWQRFTPRRGRWREVVEFDQKERLEPDAAFQLLHDDAGWLETASTAQQRKALGEQSEQGAVWLDTPEGEAWRRRSTRKRRNGFVVLSSRRPGGWTSERAGQSCMAPPERTLAWADRVASVVDASRRRRDSAARREWGTHIRFSSSLDAVALMLKNLHSVTCGELPFVPLLL